MSGSLRFRAVSALFSGALFSATVLMSAATSAPVSAADSVVHSAADKESSSRFYVGLGAQDLRGFRDDGLYDGLSLNREEDSGGMLYAGVEVLPWLSFETTLRDLGEYRADGAKQEFGALTVDALFLTPPIAGLSAYGVLGMAAVASDIRLPDTRRDSSDAGVHVGVGAQWLVPNTPIGVRASVSRIYADAEIYRGIDVGGQPFADSQDYRFRFTTAQVGVHYRF
ncbi:MAG: porin family protein [Alcanivorax sp.]|nr:porin family protein [Alcanivorax sp.]